MGKPDGAHTHESSGGDGWLIIAAIIAIVFLAGPIVSAIAGLLEIMLIILTIAIPLTLAGGVLLVIRHRRYQPLAPQMPMEYLTRPVPESIPPHQQRAIAPPEQHLHFHGVSPEEVARVIRGMRGDDG